MIPKRVSDRLVHSVGKYQQILKNARDRDVNESNTVFVIRDMLADVFGYDGHLDITSEFAVKGTYCDLAVKVDGKVEYLVEAKAIGIGLNDNHLRQVVDYGARNGVPWVILTNGMLWQIYSIRFEQPISYDLVCAFDFSELSAKNVDHQEKLFIVCKEGLNRDAREEYQRRVLALNRFVLGALILSDEVTGVIRRELRKVSNGVVIEPGVLKSVLANEVLKREIVEGEDASMAQTKIRKFYCRPRKPKVLDPVASSKNACQEIDAQTEQTPEQNPGTESQSEPSV